MAHSPPTIRDQSMIDPPCVICTQPLKIEIDHVIVPHSGLVDGRAHIACYNRRYGSMTICRACQDREAIRYDLSYLDLDGTYTPLPLCDRCHRIGMGMSVYGTEPGDAAAKAMLIEQTERQKSASYRSTFPSAVAAEPPTTAFLPVNDTLEEKLPWEYATQDSKILASPDVTTSALNPDDATEVPQ